MTDPQQIGPYTILEKLGHGACASVYLAELKHTQVALKAVEKSWASNTTVRRFLVEQKIHSFLPSHPNILTVYNSGEDTDYYYMAMELIPTSKTLEDVMDNTPINISNSIKIIIKLAKALHFLHVRGIIHCDIKPTNIMMVKTVNKSFTDEIYEPKISDFGVASCKDVPYELSEGTLNGTPIFMSPEQTKAEPSTPQSDIYTLGLLTYLFLTDTMPYPINFSDPIKEVLQGIQENEAKPIRAYRKAISLELQKIIMKAIQKDPKKRYPTAMEFARALELSLQNIKSYRKTFFSGWL